LAGRLHQSNVVALQARNDPAELNTKAAPGQWNKNLIKDGESLRGDDKENVTDRGGATLMPWCHRTPSTHGQLLVLLQISPCVTPPILAISP
jgi:hypothetical protein